jgi:hypothetical protein
VRPTLATVVSCLLCVLATPLHAGSRGRCLERFTPPGGKVLKREWIQVRGRTVREPVVLGRIALPCREKEPDARCLDRVRAATRGKHPKQKLECSRRGKGKRAAECAVLDARSHARRCRSGESDAECKSRILAEEQPKARSREVVVEVVGPEGGVKTVIEIDGRRVARTFSDFDAAAAFVQRQHGAGRRVLLLSAERRKHPGKRRARVTVQRTRERRLPGSTHLRLTWRPAGREIPRAMLRLQQRTERAGLTVVRFEPTPKGTILVELVCP